MNSKGMNFSMSNKKTEVSLDEIREALETKVDKSQKKSMVIEILTNIFLAVIMVVYLAVIIILSKNNASIDVIEKITKIASLVALFLGIVLLELSFQKDKAKIAMNAFEVIVFGGSSLFLVYIIKLYFGNLATAVKYITVGIIGYYFLKSIIICVTSISKYKKDNNDIKDIVDRKKVITDDE